MQVETRYIINVGQGYGCSINSVHIEFQGQEDLDFPKVTLIHVTYI